MRLRPLDSPRASRRSCNDTAAHVTESRTCLAIGCAAQRVKPTGPVCGYIHIQCCENGSDNHWTLPGLLCYFLWQLSIFSSFARIIPVHLSSAQIDITIQLIGNCRLTCMTFKLFGNDCDSKDGSHDLDSCLKCCGRTYSIGCDCGICC